MIKCPFIRREINDPWLSNSDSIILFIIRIKQSSSLHTYSRSIDSVIFQLRFSNWSFCLNQPHMLILWPSSLWRVFLFVFRNNNEELWYNVRGRDGRLSRSWSNQVPIWRLAEPAFGVVQRGLHRIVSSETVCTLCETRTYNVESITGETNLGFNYTGRTQMRFFFFDLCRCSM